MSECQKLDCCEPSVYGTMEFPAAGGQTDWLNVTQAYTATCPDGYTGDPVTVTIPAGTVDSTVSQDDADSQALAMAQQQAESQLVCNPVATTYYNTVQTYTADCSTGYIGDPVTVTIPAGTYTSQTSQQDANDQALAAAQSQAETQLQCSPDDPCLAFDGPVTTAITSGTPVADFLDLYEGSGSGNYKGLTYQFLKSKGSGLSLTSPYPGLPAPSVYMVAYYRFTILNYDDGTGIVTVDAQDWDINSLNGLDVMFMTGSMQDGTDTITANGTNNFTISPGWGSITGDEIAILLVEGNSFNQSLSNPQGYARIYSLPATHDVTIEFAIQTPDYATITTEIQCYFIDLSGSIASLACKLRGYGTFAKLDAYPTSQTTIPKLYSKRTFVGDIVCTDAPGPVTIPINTPDDIMALDGTETNVAGYWLPIGPTIDTALENSTPWWDFLSGWGGIVGDTQAAPTTVNGFNMTYGYSGGFDIQAVATYSDEVTIARSKTTGVVTVTTNFDHALTASAYFASSFNRSYDDTSSRLIKYFNWGYTEVSLFTVKCYGLVSGVTYSVSLRRTSTISGIPSVTTETYTFAATGFTHDISLTFVNPSTIGETVVYDQISITAI